MYIKHWIKWFIGIRAEEFPSNMRLSERGFFLFLFGLVFFFLRRLGILEHTKHLFFGGSEVSIPQKKIPPWLIDGYLIVLMLLATFFSFNHQLNGRVIECICFLIALELFQANMFYVVWRPVLVPEYKVHGNVRNLLLSMVGYVLYGWFYGLGMYSMYSIYPGIFGKPVEKFDIIYYAFVTLTTVGYGDITPASPDVKLLSIILSVSGTLFLATVIGRMISTLPMPKEYNNNDNSHK